LTYFRQLQIKFGIQTHEFARHGAVSFGGVIVAGATARGNDPNEPPKGNPVAGARGILGAVPKVGRGLVSGADALLASGFGERLSGPGLRPANADGMARFIEPSTTGFASVALSEKPLRFSVGTGNATIGVAVAEEEEGLLVRTAPFFVASGGGVRDLSFAGAGLDSEGNGEGGFPAPSHCPNGTLGDASRGLNAVCFSPLTASSSPSDTGASARGEVNVYRVCRNQRREPRAKAKEEWVLGAQGVSVTTMIPLMENLVVSCFVRVRMRQLWTVGREELVAAHY
jgi:hypothetical protein